MRSLFVFFFLLIGCSEDTKTLPQSTGKNSEVIFVVDDLLWENSIDSLVLNSFGTLIKGTNQQEPLFKIIQINSAELKSVLKKHKNIIIISNGIKDAFEYNKWASNQLVIQLNYNNSKENLLNKLIKYSDLYSKKERNALRKSINKFSQRNKEKVFFSNFDFRIIIPKEYDVIENNKSFFWANYDPINSDEIKNIFSFNFIPKTEDIYTEVLSKADSILRLYLIGAKEGTYARIEPLYKPYHLNNIYRGLWRLEGGFMGGPFLIKTYDRKTKNGINKVLVNIGVIFAPQSRKRKYIKDLEAIL